MFEQISLFDLLPEGTVARCSMDGRTAPANRPEPWMKRLVPYGEYFVRVGDHPLVLKPTRMQEEDIPEGHQYYHYTIGGQVYAGVYVGEETGGQHGV